MLTSVVFCRAQAEGVKHLVNQTMQALDMSEEAARKARKALRKVQMNLNTSRIAEVLQGYWGYYWDSFMADIVVFRFPCVVDVKVEDPHLDHHY